MKTSYLQIFLALSSLAFLQYNAANKIMAQAGNDFQKLVKKFEKDPRNEKNFARLNAAYIQAVQLALASVNETGKAGTVSGTESAINEYTSLQSLFTTIKEIPGLAEKIHTIDYSLQIDSLKKFLPIQLNEETDRLLKEGDKISCQKSYYNLLKLKTYQPGNNLVDDKIQQSLKCGSVNIVVNDPEVDPRVSHYAAEINDFSTKVLNNLKLSILSPFVKTQYKTDDPDESVFIYFKDFSVGVITKETNSRDVQANSTSTAAGRRTSRAGTLPSSATINSTHILSSSQASLRLEILNKEGVVLDKEEFNALYEWTDDITTYTGDSRSLTSSDRALLRNQSKSMPSENTLVSDLLKQLSEKVLAFLRARYTEK